MQIESVGPYRIEKHLGSGGMGTVYLAWDDRLKRKVAIKSIHPAKELSEERLERLRREAQAIASINHPAVTHVHDIITEAGRDYIVMEYVEGRSLTSLLTETPLPSHRAVNIARQIAAGLAAAHEKGVIHRDLKPENVMIDASGNVKILDFGLAKSTAEDTDQVSLTEEGMVMGTSRAMSPEQARGEHVDARSDLFSLGSIIYELITGKHPFQASNPLDTMHRIVKHRQAPPRRYQPEIPIELGLLVEKLLEKDRKNRPSSAKEIAVALDALAEGDSTKTSNLTTLDKLTAQARRRRNWRRFWPLGVAALALIVAGFVTWQWIESIRPVETTAIAVLKPVNEQQVHDPDAVLFSEALRMAIINGAAALQGLVVIDTSDVDAVDNNPKLVAHAVAADEVLATDFTKAGNNWAVTIRRLKRTVNDDRPLSLAWSVSLDLPADDLSLVGNAIGSQMRSCFPRLLQDASRFVSSASSTDFATYLRIRKQYSSGQKYTESLTALEELRSRAPRLLEATISTVGLARWLYQVTSQPEFLDRAQNALSAASRIAPNDPRTIREKAETAFVVGDLELAQAAINELREAAPADPWLYRAFSLLSDREGKSQEAREYLVRQVDRRPSFRSYLELAQFDRDHGHPDLAIASLNTALKLVPNHDYTREKLAEVELLYGDIPKAQKLLESLIEESPEPRYLSKFAMAHLLSGSFETARSYYQKVVELTPDRALAMLNFADSLALTGDVSGANIWYEKALAATNSSMNQADPATLQIRAQAFAHLGKRNDAVAEIRQCLRVSPDDPFSQLCAALVYTLASEHTSAVFSARRAIELKLAPRWFELPWFDPIREDPDFVDLTTSAAFTSKIESDG
jgi:serine/threonine-protein kinase